MKRLQNSIIKYPFAITALICLIFYFLPFKPKPFGDGENHEGAIQLIEYILNGFQGNVRVDKGLFTLFYLLIPYSVVYYFKSQAAYYAAAVIFNAIFTCFAVRYLFKAFDLMRFSVMAKFWTLVLICLFPIHVYYAFGISSEAASFFAISLFVYLWVKMVATRDYSVTRFVELALVVVAFVGMRPNMLPFALALIIFIMFLKIDWKPKITFAMTFIATMSLLVFAEGQLSTNDGEFKKMIFRNQLVWSRFELRDEPLNWMPQHGQDRFASSDYLNNLAKRRELDSICEANNLDKTTYFVNWVVDDITSNPGLALRQYFLKFFQAQSFVISPLMKSDKSDFVKYSIHGYINLVNYVLVFFSLFGIVRLIRQRKYKLLLPFIFLWGWSLIYIFLFHSEQRYMFSVRPIVIFFAIYYADHLFRNFESAKYHSPKQLADDQMHS